MLALCRSHFPSPEKNGTSILRSEFEEEASAVTEIEATETLNVRFRTHEMNFLLLGNRSVFLAKATVLENLRETNEQSSILIERSRLQLGFWNRAPELDIKKSFASASHATRRIGPAEHASNMLTRAESFFMDDDERIGPAQLGNEETSIGNSSHALR